jgi:hypothetical protein
MGKRNVPQPFDIDKIRFKDCFTGPSLRHFAVLITGWALTMGTHTVSQVILTMKVHESEHFANTYKFLLKSKWNPDKVAFKIFKPIVETLLPDAAEVEIILDDTLNSRVGKTLQAAADRFTPEVIRQRIDYWTLILGPKFSKRERKVYSLECNYFLSDLRRQLLPTLYRMPYDQASWRFHRDGVVRIPVGSARNLSSLSLCRLP